MDETYVQYNLWGFLHNVIWPQGQITTFAEICYYTNIWIAIYLEIFRVNVIMYNKKKSRQYMTFLQTI
jgi:hypothetical protein